MKKILITGGAGFIGTNTAFHYLNKKDHVTIFDNFSRDGSVINAKYLTQNFKNNLTIVKGDTRILNQKLNSLIAKHDVVIHLAGQTAVTTSVQNPFEDFQSNALGTLNVLEAIRKSKSKPILLYSSTNKVYGNLEKLKIVEKKTRFEFANLPFGVSEEMGLDFHSPYGCSKGAADQYVRDYARIYGLKTIVFRQSCIYGPRQFGVEGQGWLAWIILAAINNQQVNIYGKGKQVRDILHINDLVKAYDLALNKIKTTSGQVYNIGGGPENTISVWYEFAPFIEKLINRKIKVKFSNERPGDQKVYVSDIRKSKKDFAWEPKVDLSSGIEDLFAWIKNQNK